MINIVAQLLGYLAFVFLAVSLWVNSDFKFRWINSLGSLSFIFYGILLHDLPVVLNNLVLLAINIYFLIKIYKRQEKFDLAEVRNDNPLIQKFLSFYQKDIETGFPGFKMGGEDSETGFVVLRDMVIAHLFVVTVKTNGDAFVKINYTVPKYRDYKAGKFLFDEGKELLHSKGIKRIIYTQVHDPKQEIFLIVMGFKKERYEATDCYMKDI